MRSEKKPTKEELEELYAAALAFQKATPWKWLYDVDVIAVEDPQDKTIGYCSVMGRSGKHFALGVYLGEEGFYGFNYLLEYGEDMPSYEAIFYQDCLMCSFEGRAMLDKPDWQEIKEMGLAFSGEKAWPQFRRFQRGFFPWFINQKECSFLTHALQQTLIVAEEYRQGKLELDFKRGKTILRHSRQEQGQLLWQSKELQLQVPYVEYQPVLFENDLFLQKLKRAEKRSTLVLEADACFLPMTVQGEKEDRPYFPRAFIIADSKAGLVLDYAMYENEGGDGEEALLCLTDFILEEGIPQRIEIRPGKMEAILKSFCEQVGIELAVVDYLPVVQEFLTGIAQMY